LVAHCDTMRSFTTCAQVGETEDMNTRTTRITIETESTVLVRQGRTVVAWCPECRAEVEVVLLSDGNSAAQLLSLGSALIHLSRPDDGQTQVCMPSLLACAQANEVKKFQTIERNLLHAERSLPTEEKDDDAL
jgi:hypothetical protein